MLAGRNDIGPPSPKHFTAKLAKARSDRNVHAKIAKSTKTSWVIIREFRLIPEEVVPPRSTLHRLGLFSQLGISLKTTNCLESLNSLVEQRVAKVDHWRVGGITDLLG